MLENVAADFQYAGYYLHSSSGLSFTDTRAYNTRFGRFINRDPIAESGGINLYGYVGNMPVAMSDPTGLDPACKNPCPPNWTGSVLVGIIGGYSIWVNCYKGQQTGNGTVSGNGGSAPFSYNTGNGPMQQGAQAAANLASSQYYNNQLSRLAIFSAILGGLLIVDAALGVISAKVAGQAGNTASGSQNATFNQLMADEIRSDIHANDPNVWKWLDNIFRK